MALKNRAKISTFPRVEGQRAGVAIRAPTIQGHADVINALTQELRLPLDLDGGKRQAGDEQTENEGDEVLVVESFQTTDVVITGVENVTVRRFTEIVYIRPDGRRWTMPIPDPDAS